MTTYQLNLGSGAQEVANGAAGASPSGVLQIGPGIDSTKLWLTQSGNNLVIGIPGTSDQVTFDGWFANDYSKLNQLVLADDSSLSTSAITTLANVDTHYQAAHPGDNDNYLTDRANDPGLQAEVAAVWDGSSYLVSGASGQTVSASGLGVHSVFDLGSGGNTLTGGASTVIIGGNNDILNGSGVFVADGRNVTVAGTPSQVDVTANTTVKLSGGDYVVYGDSAVIDGSISATGVTSFHTSRTSINVAGAYILLDGPANSVDLGSPSATLVEAGSNNSVLMGGAGEQVVISGVSSSATTYLNAETINLLGAAESATLVGNQDHVSIYGSAAFISTLGVGDTVAVFASGATINATSGAGAVVYAAPNVATTYNGMGGEVDLDVGASVTLTGKNNVINGSVSGGSVITISGGNSTGDTVNLAQVGNHVTLGGGATSATVNLNALGGLTYGGTGSTLNLGSFSQVQASGSGNTFNLLGQGLISAAATSVSLTSGHDDTFNASGFDAITLGAGVVGTVVNVADSANVTVLGSGATVNVAGNANVGLVGDGNTLNSNAPGFFTASGNANTFNIGGVSDPSALTVAATNGATGTVVNTLANTAFTYTGAASTLNLAAGSYVTAFYSSGGAFNVISGSGQIDLQNGSSNTFNLGGAYGDNSVATINQGSGVTGTVVNGGGIIFLSGGGATINSSANEAVFLQGAGYQINLVGNGTNINFNGAVGVNTISNSGGPSSQGTLIMADGQGPTHIWMDRSGNDLKITEMGKAEVIVITDWFSGPSHQLYSMGTPTHGISNTNVAGLVSAMATYEASYASSHGGVAFDPTAAANGTITDVTVVAAVNAAWH